jgi:serine/threonine protein kinase/tetratricopeptide (TPR) repeat protein
MPAAFVDRLLVAARLRPILSTPMVVATHSSRDCLSRDEEHEPTNNGDMPSAAASDGDETSTHVLEPGVYVARYRILDVVGTGGIGVVYAAFDEALGRNVALKLLRPNARNPNKLERRRARLIREAQALARLSHPNVVPIYEVGMFEDRVFLAMEYVEGSTMRRWLRRSERSWTDILDKYIQAGRGLAAAHAADIVHRDFKPDNVLVGDDGRVRVLDFGLATPVPDALATGRYSTVALDDAPMHKTNGGARQLNSAVPRPIGQVGTGRLAEPIVTGLLTDSTMAARGSPSRMPDASVPGRLAESVSSLITAHGKIMGTPAYMAPEQGRGEPIDARADQYSFCVSLGEALFGERPHGPPTATARIRLHRRLGERNSTGKDVPAEIQRALERGLSLHPVDRFPDMDSLLAELARKPAGHRRWLLVGAIPLVIGLGFAIGSLASSAPDECVRDQAALEGVWDDRVRVQIGTRLTATDRAYADATWETVSRELDRWSSRWLDARVDACTDNKIHEQSAVLFDMRMACLDRQLDALAAVTESLAGLPIMPDMPDMQDEVAKPTIANDEADELLETALAAVLELPDPSRCERLALVGGAMVHEGPPEFDERLEDHRVLLARARGLLGLQSSAKLDEALTLVDQVVGLTAEQGMNSGIGTAHARDQALVAEAKLLRGQILAAAGKPDEAGHELRRALFIAQASGHDAVTIEACAALVDLAHMGAMGVPSSGSARELEHAADWVDLGRATLARIGGDLHLEATLRLANARLANARGEFQTALDEQARVLELREELYGPSHVEVAKVLVEQVQTKIQLGQHEAAELDIERALALLTAEFGITHPEVGIAHGHAAALARARADEAEAKSRLLDALAIFEIAYDEKHPRVIATYMEIAAVHVALGQPEQALAALVRARKRATEFHAHGSSGAGADDPSLLPILIETANVLHALARHDEARSTLDEAERICKTLDESHPYQTDLALARGTLEADTGNLDAALAHYRDAHELQLANPERDDRRVGLALGLLASVQARQGDLESALAQQRQALALREAVLGPDDPGLALHLAWIGRSLVELDRGEEARPYLDRAIDSSRLDPRLRALARLAIAELTWTQDAPHARELARIAITELESLGPPAALDVDAANAWLRQHQG